MVEKVKDFVTYGEIDEETYKLMKEKRGDDANHRPAAILGAVRERQPFSHGLCRPDV